MEKLILASPLIILYFIGFALRKMGKKRELNSLGSKEYKALGITLMIIASALAVIGLIFFE